MDTRYKLFLLSLVLCGALQASAYQLRDLGCNTTAFNESLGGNLTNRCDGVSCKRDDQCNSTYCVTNS